MDLLHLADELYTGHELENYEYGIGKKILQVVDMAENRQVESKCLRLSKYKSLYICTRVKTSML